MEAHKWAQLRTTTNPDKGLGKERRVHAAEWQKGPLPAEAGVPWRWCEAAPHKS